MRRTIPVATALLAGVALFASLSPSFAADVAIKVPAAVVSAPAIGHRETAVFAGGCFWGVQGVFAHVKGVESTVAGYEGGTRATARYDSVSTGATGATGHAEAVKVVFDPAQVSYAELLRIYFSVVADPTQLDRQGPDEGTQYRTALFPQSASQARVARAYIAQLSATHVFRRPIVTTLETGRGFFAAESHHQDFMARNPGYSYIVINDRPKVEALKTLFPQHWRA